MKRTTTFVCQSCGAQSPKWLGRCPDCSAWNTFVEERTADPATPSSLLSSTVVHMT